MSIFQRSVISGKKGFMDEKMSYNNTHFYCPRVYAKDGFFVSLQANYCNYCSSENGCRTLGHTMEEVEFGFPSMNEPLMFEYSEMYGQDDYSYEDDGTEIIYPFNHLEFNVTGTVGRIPVSVMETVFEKHGGIDWDKTISIESFNDI
jgi:hypothetical protein